MNTWTLKGDRSIAYRRLRDGDGESLQEFYRRLTKQSHDFFTPHAFDEETVARVVARSESDDDRVYIALDGRSVVAYFFLWWYKTKFPVLGIGIADEYQGIGLGRLIMSKLIEDARESGCDAVELTTTLENKRAYGLYEKVGFRCVGKVDNVDGSGEIVVEWHMIYPFAEGISPPERRHQPPV